MRFENIVWQDWIKKSDIDKINDHFISNEQINMELESISRKEWDEQCAIVDEMLKCCVESNNYKPDKILKAVMTANLISIGADCNVSAAALWTAYIKWLS